MTETALFPGVYRGVVHDNRDPLGKGRLKIRVAQLLGNTPTSWAWPVETPSAEFQLPEIGQGIWVVFEGGDIGYPIWIGQFGKELSENYSLKFDKLKASEDISDVTDLLEIDTKFDGIKQLDVTQTLLNLVRNRYYGSFYDTSTHSAALANTAYPMHLDTTDSANGVSIVDDTKITIANNGVYNIAFSAQFAASNNAEHTVNIWLRHQGVDVPGSASRLLFKDHTIAAWNFFVKTNTEPQYWELMWSTGTGSNVVSLATLPASSPVPSIPAVILTVNKVR